MNAPHSVSDAPIFVSALLVSLERGQGAPHRGNAQQWAGWLDGAQRRGEFRQAERDWLGLDGWLTAQDALGGKSALRDLVDDGRMLSPAERRRIVDNPGLISPQITREQLVAYVHQHQVVLQEVTLGENDLAEVEAWWNDEGGANEEVPFEDLTVTERAAAVERYREEVGQYAMSGSSPKFARYQLPGGEEYRELLLTLPGNHNALIAAEARRLSYLNSQYGQNLDDEPVGSDLRAEIEVLRAKEPSSSFQSSHFDQPNILAHVRFNERIYVPNPPASVEEIEKRIVGAVKTHEDAESKAHAVRAAIRDGAITADEGAKYANAKDFAVRGVTDRKALFLEEVQSDWHQQGRRQGYSGEAGKLSEEQSQVLRQLWSDMKEKYPFLSYDQPYPGDDEAVARVGSVEVDAAMDAAGHPWPDRRQVGQIDAVPDAPFKTTWPMLAMKRMVRYAAEHGFDRIAWTTGEQQADRYDLSKQVSSIAYQRLAGGSYDIKVRSKEANEMVWEDSSASLEEIEKHIGKELAAKIETGVGFKSRRTTYLEGLDLKVGGEGMAAFYDKILPAAVNKWARNFGASVVELSVSVAEDDADRFEVVLANGKVVQSTASRKQAEATAGCFDGAEVREIVLVESVHGLDVTPAMREAALAGLPLFKRQVAEPVVESEEMEEDDDRPACRF